jgi:KDO2-lipid IV(A) lauroyltransferase
VAPHARVALYKTIGGLFERLPERVDVALASTIAKIVGRRSTSARANLTTNVAQVLGGEGVVVPIALLERFVERGFASYGRYWAEGAKLPALGMDTIVRRFQIAEGREHLDAAKARGAGTIVALPHIGSWEWGGSFLSSIDMGMTAVAEELEPPELFEWFTKKREAIGITIRALDEHAGTLLLQTIRDGGVVGLLCDRDIQDNGIEVEFFGERVTIPAGPATLALRTGATLVCAACYSGPGRDHHAVVTAPIDATRTGKLREDVARVTQLIAIDLEGLIRRAPEQWHVLQPRFAT